MADRIPDLRSPAWLEQMNPNDRAEDKLRYVPKQEILERFTKEELYNALNHVLITASNRQLNESWHSANRWIKDIDKARKESDDEKFFETERNSYVLLEEMIWKHHNVRSNFNGSFRRQ